MDIQFRSVAPVSRMDGKPFEDGEKVVSFLIKGDAGVYERLDVREAEEARLKLSGDILCRWVYVIKDREDEAAARKQQVVGAEAMFLALYEEPSEDGSEETDVLRYLLALLLERKRILKAKPSKASSITYVHVKSKEEYCVPQPKVTPEKLMAIQQQLDAVVGS